MEIEGFSFQSRTYRLWDPTGLLPSKYQVSFAREKWWKVMLTTLRYLILVQRLRMCGSVYHLPCILNAEVRK